MRLTHSLLVCVYVFNGLLPGYAAATDAGQGGAGTENKSLTTVPDMPADSSATARDQTDDKFSVATSSSPSIEAASESLENLLAAFSEHLVAQRLSSDSRRYSHELFAMWLPGEYMALLQQESRNLLRSQGIANSATSEGLLDMEALVRGKLILVCASYRRSFNQQPTQFLSRSKLLESLQVRVRPDNGEAVLLKASVNVHPFAAHAVIDFLATLASEMGRIAPHVYAVFYDLPLGLDLTAASVGTIEISLSEFGNDGDFWRISLPNPACAALQEAGPQLLAAQAAQYADGHLLTTFTALEVPKQISAEDWRPHAQAADAAYQLGDYVSVVRECDKAIGLLGGSESINDDLGKSLLLRKAVALQLLRACKLAESVLEQIKGDGDASDPIVNRKMQMLVELYTISGRYNDAIAASDAILKHLPPARDVISRRRRAAALAARAVPLFELGRRKEAKEALDEGLELLPQGESDIQELRAMVCSVAGNLSLKEDDYADAAQRFEQAALIQAAVCGEAHPTTLITLSNLCRSLDKLGETEKVKTVEHSVAALELAAVSPGLRERGYVEINPATSATAGTQGGVSIRKDLGPRSDHGVGALVMWVLYFGVMAAISRLLGAEMRRLFPAVVLVMLSCAVVVLMLLSMESATRGQRMQGLYWVFSLPLGFVIVKMIVRAFAKSSNRQGMPLTRPRMRAGIACVLQATVGSAVAGVGGMFVAGVLRGPSYATPLESCLLKMNAAVIPTLIVFGVAWMIASVLGSIAQGVSHPCERT